MEQVVVPRRLASAGMALLVAAAWAAVGDAGREGPAQSGSGEYLGDIGEKSPGGNE